MNPSTAYRRGSRLPEHVEAYNKYMKEYMRNYVIRKNIVKMNLCDRHYTTKHYMILMIVVVVIANKEYII